MRLHLEGGRRAHFGAALGPAHLDEGSWPPEQIGRLLEPLLPRLRDYLIRRVDHDHLESLMRLMKAGPVQALLTQLREGVVVLDGDRRVLAMNAAAHETLGARAQVGAPLPEALARGLMVEELAPGDALAQAHPPRLARMVRQHALDLLDRPEQARRQLELTETLGGQVCACALELQGTGAGEVLVNVRDLTRERRLERSSQRVRAQLERSHRELEHFAHAASHDLQEPLRKIMTFGDRLHRRYQGALDERGRDDLARMRRAAARMSRLIEGLKQFSKVHTRAADFEEVSLDELMGDVISDLERSSHLMPESIEVRGALPTLRGDRAQLSQLFEQLLDNALKFTREGEPLRVEIRGRLVGESPAEGGRGTWCEIAVRDNGIGFDPRYAERIFEPFERLHDHSSGHEGAGIGLAVSQRIVERHGGRLRAHGSPEQGAVFTVGLPLTPHHVGVDDEPSLEKM